MKGEESFTQPASPSSDRHMADPAGLYGRFLLRRQDVGRRQETDTLYPFLQRRRFHIRVHGLHRVDGGAEQLEGRSREVEGGIQDNRDDDPHWLPGFSPPQHGIQICEQRRADEQRQAKQEKEQDGEGNTLCLGNTRCRLIEGLAALALVLVE